MSLSVYVVHETNDSGAEAGIRGVFHSRESAAALARDIIGEYGSNSRVHRGDSSVILGLLDAFNEAEARGEDSFGIGDDNCVFYVDVVRWDVEA